MQIEKFNSGEKSGYKIIGATFASSKNINGAFFDPVEVFTAKVPNSFNFGHQDYKTDYSQGTTITKEPQASLDGKMLRFTWDLETTNENFIKLIETEKFGGFSPELLPIKKPLLGNRIGTDKKGDPIFERFYRSGDLEWQNTAILEKNQIAGFVGAKDFALEKFEAIEGSDVVLAVETFEAETENKPTELENRIAKMEGEIANLKENNKESFGKKEENLDELQEEKAKLQAEIQLLNKNKETFTSSLPTESEKQTKGEPVQKLSDEKTKELFTKLSKNRFIK